MAIVTKKRGRPANAVASTAKTSTVKKAGAPVKKAGRPAKAAASAVKTQGNNSYVEVFDQQLPGGTATGGAPSPTLPRQVPVQVGISNDTSTEITSGLKEGDIVVTRTITGASTASAAQAPSLFGNTRALGGGGGARAAGGGRGN